ncbi:MAG TPA: kynureninase [Pseudomonadales bacterium]|nr:kynureninase [Pseudomonadales bacterium]
MDRAACEALDAADPLAPLRSRFRLPAGRIYLDGNSLGVPPESALAALQEAATTEWAGDLIGAWNSRDWIDLPQRVGERIAPLIGAGRGQVLACDSTSVNLFKLLVTALGLRPGRTTVLSAEGNFPTDLYMVEGLAELLGSDRCRLKTVPADAVVDAVDDDTAVVLLTQVDFRSGARFDLAAVTAAVQARGALMLWDLAHSAGAMPVDLDGAGVDLAVGCGYKYLNGGPGAPAFLYVAERHQAAARQPLSGWMGHARPFDFDPAYAPAPGVDRFLCGTPPVLAFRALEGALEVFDDVDMEALRAKSVALCDSFIALVEARPELADLTLVSPRDGDARGSQVAFAHPDAYAIVRALIDADVVGDFREPDVMRFGFAPLYLRFVDLFDAVAQMARIVADGSHLQQPVARGRVT